MLGFVIVGIIGALIGYLIGFTSDKNWFEEIDQPVKWESQHEYKVTRWGYNFEKDKVEAVSLWVDIKCLHCDEQGELTFDRNDEFEENYKELQVWSTLKE